MTTIYVTGSAGFIGSHFIAKAAAKLDGPEVVPLDIGLQGQDAASVERVLEHVGEKDLVVLLGAEPAVAKYATYPRGDVDTNVRHIVSQMWAARNAKLIILASSFGGLFAAPNMTRVGRAASTDDQPWPVSAYFAGKIALEAYLHAQHRQVGTPYRVARFANVYGGRGPNQLAEWRGVIPDWIQRRRLGQPFDVWGDLQATRDYIYVADVVEALWRLWQKVDRAIGDVPSSGLHIHVGTGVLTSLKDLGLVIATTEPNPMQQTTETGAGATPVEPAFTFEEARPGYTVEGSAVDLVEAQAVLRNGVLWRGDWEPMDLAEGLRRTWQTFLMEGRE